MKAILFILPFLIIELSMPAQTAETFQPAYRKASHSFGDVTVSVSPDILLHTPHGIIFAGGLKLRLFMGKRISFDSDFMIGHDFIQFAPGLIGIPSVIFLDDIEDQTFSGIILMTLIQILSFEHISYHIPLRHSDISPYLSFLRYRQFENLMIQDKVDYMGSACFAIGVEANNYFNRFVLSPYIDYTAGYSKPIHDFTLGINCGWYFPVRR